MSTYNDQESNAIAFSFVDAHSHVDRYGDNLDTVLSEIKARRILTISNSMDVASYKRNLEIATKCSLAIPAFGIHPWMAPQYVDKLAELDEHIDSAPVLGETGLDHHFVEDTSQYPAQMKVFEHLLAASAKQRKPICLHTKGAESEVVELINKYKPERVVVHWYSGPLRELDELIALGAYFTAGVEVLHSKNIKEIARRIPNDRLLTETDNPGGWEWLTGEPGMPRLVLDVIAELARLRGAEQGFIAKLVSGNCLRLLDRDPCSG